MLDADAQAQHLRRDTRRLQLLRRQLAMRGRGRMARQGLGVADIDKPLDHLERVIEFHASVEANLDAEGQQRRWPALAVLLCQRVVEGTFTSAGTSPFTLFSYHPITPH